MNWLSRQIRSWGPVGFSWALIATLAVVGTLYFVPPIAKDALDTPETISDDLKAELTADLGGHDLVPGPSQGAAPNTAYGRPVSWFADQGTPFEWQPSPNWAGRGSNPIEAIVVHVTAGGTCDGIVNFFKAPGGVAAHFLACPNKVVQQVDLGDGAFHAGIWGARLNPHNNRIIENWWRNGYYINLRTVGIETLLKPGEQLDNFPTMRENLIDLLVYLVKELDLPPDREHIIGHYELDMVQRPIDPICCMNLDAVVLEVAKRVNAPASATGINQAEVSIFTRVVGSANPSFFNGLRFSGSQRVWASLDYQLPADVRLIEVEFFLSDGSATVYDGATQMAGRGCFIQANIVKACKVLLDSDGWFELEGTGTIDQLVITGTYR